MANNPKLNIPSEARSTGPANLNESVSDKERTGEPLSDLSAGPKVGATGNYLPARYPLANGVICEDR